MKYTSIFAQDNHLPVRKVSDIKPGWRGASLYLFLNGKEIGSGELSRAGKNTVHTGAVGLRRGLRRKGHGIHLYLALIAATKSIGATRIYSDTRLNKYSRRMWKDKLREHFTVKDFVACKNACRHCKRKNRYYIEL